MLIVCPSCATSYDVDPASLEPNGRKVRCVRCRTVWLAEPSRAERLSAAAAALAPEPDSLPMASDAEISAGGIPAETAGAMPDAEAFAAPETPPEPSQIGEGDVPSIVPGDSPELLPALAAEAAGPADEAADAFEDVETVAARRFPGRARRHGMSLSLSRLQMVILALLVINSAVVGWRAAIVRALPQTASFYALIGLPVNLRGLAFDRVSTRIEQHEGIPILVVQGDIVNVSGSLAAIPRLRLSVRNAAHQVIYSWTVAAERETLPPGLGIAFVSRLASPPPGSSDVLVRFLSPRDLIAGML